MEDEAVYQTKNFVLENQQGDSILDKLLGKQEVTLIIDIEPMGAVRTTTKQKFVDKSYQAYSKYKDSLLWLWKKACLDNGILIPNLYTGIVSIEFGIEIPSAKYKERIGNPHEQKPDLDNLLKGFLDALVPDDQKVSRMGPMQKVWAEKGYIKVVLLHRT